MEEVTFCKNARYSILFTKVVCLISLILNFHSVTVPFYRAFNISKISFVVYFFKLFSICVMCSKNISEVLWNSSDHFHRRYVVSQNIPTPPILPMEFFGGFEPPPPLPLPLPPLWKLQFFFILSNIGLMRPISLLGWGGIDTFWKHALYSLSVLFLLYEGFTSNGVERSHSWCLSL